MSTTDKLTCSTRVHCSRGRLHRDIHAWTLQDKDNPGGLVASSLSLWCLMPNCLTLVSTAGLGKDVWDIMLWGGRAAVSPGGVCTITVSQGTSDLPGAGFLGRPLEPSKEEQTRQQSTTWGKKGLFCPFLVLAQSSTVALPPTQSCPSPLELCLDPNDVPTATTSSQLPPAAAANPQCPCLGRALPPSPALGTVSAGPLPAPRALSKHISQLEDKNIPFLTPRAIDFACSCGGGEGGRTRGRER